MWTVQKQDGKANSELVDLTHLVAVHNLVFYIASRFAGYCPLQVFIPFPSLKQFFVRVMRMSIGMRGLSLI